MVTAAALLPACGLGDREAMADRLVDAVHLAVNAGTATGTLTVTGELVSLPASAQAFAAASGQELELPPPTAPVTYGVRLDLRTARATLLAGDQPIEVWDDLDLYGRRRSVAENEARPWARVTLEDLDDGEADLDPEQDSPIVAVHALNPTLLVDLVAGALTGSVDRAGTDEIGGQRVTRYDANFDLEKTTTDTRDDAYDDDRREAIEKLFDILTVKGGVHGGSVWLDAGGLPRRVELRLRTEPELDTRVDVTLTLTIEAFDTGTAIEPPSSRDWLEVSSVVGFLRTITPESLYLSAFGGEQAGTAP